LSLFQPKERGIERALIQVEEAFDTWRIRLARPSPCCGPIAVSVRNTIRSSTPDHRLLLTF
jgi:hypothetical protein